jgi:hypothetical protein
MLSSPYHLPQWRKYNISKLWWPPDIPRPSCQNLLLSQACSLRNDTGALGSQWMFGTRDRSTYILLFPIEDAQTVPALKTDGPLTADDDFFPTELRNKIKIHKVVSRDPRDWYLKEMKVVTQGGEEVGIPELNNHPASILCCSSLRPPNTMEVIRELVMNHSLPVYGYWAVYCVIIICQSSFTAHTVSAYYAYTLFTSYCQSLQICQSPLGESAASVTINRESHPIISFYKFML